MCPSVADMDPGATKVAGRSGPISEATVKLATGCVADQIIGCAQQKELSSVRT